MVPFMPHFHYANCQSSGLFSKGFIPAHMVVTTCSGIWSDGDSDACPEEGKYSFGVEVAGKYIVLDAKHLFNVS